MPMPHNSTRRRATAAAFATVAAITVLAAPAPAYAEEPLDYTQAGAAIRTKPNLDATIVGYGYPGQGLRNYCLGTGQALNGNQLWIHHTNKATGKTGWSHVSVTEYPLDSSPRC